MNIKIAFGKALFKVRKSRSLTQEDFALISSRTYISSLERGIQSPTLEKIEGLSKLLEIHPLILLFMAYQEKENENLEGVLNQMQKNLVSVISAKF